MILLALKFGFRDDSVSIVTEGLGPKPFHSRTVVLVDESTSGAGERIAAFAQERQLAPVVGARTSGRLICCSMYKVPMQVTCSLPSTAITPLHRYYGAVRPCLAHRYFQPHGASVGAFSLNRANQVLKLRTKARMRFTPPVHWNAFRCNWRCRPTLN